MHGNVWELCSNNVVRGGGYDSSPSDCRSRARSNRLGGFRLCLSAKAPK